MPVYLDRHLTSKDSLMPLVSVLLAVAFFAQGTFEFMLAGLLTVIAGDLTTSIPETDLLTSAFAVGMITLWEPSHERHAVSAGKLSVSN